MRIISFVSTVVLLLNSHLVVSQVNRTSKEFIVPKKNVLASDIDSLSYILGLNVAKQFKKDAKEINEALFIQGFLNGKESKDLLITADERQIRNFLGTYFKRKQEKVLVEKYGAHKKQNEDFLAENKLKEGVKTTQSGLQYVVLKEGVGASPTKESRVKVHYHGTLINGTVFDSSVERGQPTEFSINRVIKGWTEGVQLMKIGAKYKFFIPQELAYGSKEPSPEIKPFSTLIFEVELLEIK